MPIKPSRPCKSPICGGKTTAAHGYCEAHADRAINWGKSKRGGQGRGGRPWRRLRNAILKRDRYLCQPCERMNRITPATEVDHIVGKAQGGTDAADNLEAICKACHQAKTISEALAARSGDHHRP
ncbi:HNH endonuclease [Cobetia amphilecti]|uniref:HNH endonuclease n=2 Tax=Cobetia TaxID=204286 RepID=UPI003296EA94